MVAGITGYYRRHPERLGDDRSLEAIEVSTKHGLARMLAVLDNYDITSRTQK